jgi:hypothetical protein
LLHKRSLALAHKHNTRLVRLARDEYSSFLKLGPEKSFYRIGPWSKVLMILLRGKKFG